MKKAINQIILSILYGGCMARIRTCYLYDSQRSILPTELTCPFVPMSSIILDRSVINKY